jgi:dTDP-D-glucose 4,6-dehydratase
MWPFKKKTSATRYRDAMHHVAARTPDDGVYSIDGGGMLIDECKITPQRDHDQTLGLTASQSNQEIR